MPSAAELYAGTKNVIGQEKARKQLAVLLERQQMVARGTLKDSTEGAIIAGWTGSGKTFLARSMCSNAGLPFAEVNGTQYTEAGYVGLNLTQMFLPLMAAAAEMIDKESGNEPEAALLEREDVAKVIALAEVGVVVIDEFDKWMLSGTDSQNRNTGRKLQAELLKMVEGSTEYVTDDDENIGHAFHTNRVLIICAGAFVGLARLAAARLGREDYTDPGIWDFIIPEDFVRFGMLPELSGRLAIFIAVRPLKEEHLVRIMLEPGGSVEEYRTRFRELGIEWAIPDEALTTIARIALDRGTGARGVNHVMWQTFGEALFDATAAEGRTTVRFLPNTPKAWLD